MFNFDYVVVESSKDFGGVFQVNINNLEEYISLVVDATVKTGILRQIEAFRAGFNQVRHDSFYFCKFEILNSLNCC